MDAALGLMRLILGGFAAQVPRALAELGVADRMAEAAWSADDLADELSVHAPSLQRLLEAAASLELVSSEAGRYRLSDTGRLLRADALGPVATMYAGDHFWATARGLADSVRNGETATRNMFGAGSTFELYGADPVLAAGFDAAMTAMSDLTGPPVAAAYDFRGLVIDVGGGQGRLLAHILAAHPDATGLVFEVPKVAEKARAFLAGQGLADRCAVAEGDMFEAVPQGGDLYLMSAVIHDWADEPAVRALEAVRRAMRPEARLLLVERVLAQAPSADPLAQTHALTDLMMLVRTGGRERTAAAYADLLAQAGFEMLRVIPTNGPRAIVEARPR